MKSGFVEKDWAEKAAWQLRAQVAVDNTSELAFLKSGATLYFARHSPQSDDERRPHSAVTKLIQGIYDHDAAFARQHVRHRIFSTAQPSVMCLGMVRVAARRLSAPVVPVNHDGIDVNENLVEVTNPAPKVLTSETVGTEIPEKFHSDAEAMGYAFKLAGLVARPIHAEAEKKRFELNRRIAAVLMTEDGTFLGCGINSNARNRTLHAEVNLLQDYYARTEKLIPRGARLVSTMKPCRMCAAMIWYLAEDVTTLKISYAEFDAGPCARESILDAGSFDRRQACLLGDSAHAFDYSSIPVDLQLEKLI